MKSKSVALKVATMILLVGMGVIVLGNTAVASAEDQSQNANQIRIVRALMNALLDTTEKAIGEAKANIALELGLGKTLADVINAHHGDVSAIEAAAKAAVTDQIHKIGSLTQAQASKLLDRLDSALDQLVNHKWPGNLDGRIRLLRAEGLRFLIAETAKESNIKQRDILPDLRAGKTLAQIATAHQADPSKIVTAAVESGTTRINTMVKNGRLTQDQANIVLAALPDVFTQMMNQTYPLGGVPKKSSTTQPAIPGATPAATSAM